MVDTVIVKDNYDKLLELEKDAQKRNLNIWSIYDFVTVDGYDEKYKK